MQFRRCKCEVDFFCQMIQEFLPVAELQARILVKDHGKVRASAPTVNCAGCLKRLEIASRKLHGDFYGRIQESSGCSKMNFTVGHTSACNGYHRYGKENCSSHRVDEAQLDKLIYDELLEMKEGAEANYKSIEHDVKKWLSQKNTSEKKVKALSDKLKQRKSDQEQILLERIRDREHADIYTGMLTKCEKDISNITAELAAIQDYDATIRKRKAEMKSSIDILGEIVKEGAISDSNLRLLIDDIVISECGGKLSINIHLKAAFRSHLDIYDENGQLTDQAFAVS